MLNSLDQTITIALYDFIPHSAIANKIFSFFSFYGFSVVIWFLATILLILFEEKKNKLFIIFLSTSILVTFLLNNVLIKNMVKRHRPVVVGNYKIIKCPKDFSFPSGHASVAFAGAVILAAFDKKRRWYYYLIALSISYSRIYLGCHFFFDVVAGGIVGTSVSIISLKLAKRTA